MLLREGLRLRLGRDSASDKFLRESGYDIFPVLTPRWEVTGEDVYGTSCPGMEALGDIKQLQLGERRSFEAIEKMIRPPMVAPTSMKNQASSILPGDITYTDVRDGQQGFRPALEVNFRINEMEMKQEQIRHRINRAFYADLFLMLASSDRRQITAREIDERHEEKLLALGPVLEQLNQDLLDPLIDVAFDIHVKQGLLPPPPEELQDVELKVEYISIMAQAQKLVGIGGIERFSGFVGQVAQFTPEVLDKLNTDQAVDVYADITSVPPGIVRTDEEVAGIRGNRAERQQAGVMVIFGHLAGLLLGGGAALAADRMMLDAARRDATRRASGLEALPRVHRVVLRSLALAAATGVLLTLADLDVFLSARVFYLKGGLFVLLHANGLVLMSGERAVRSGEDVRGWRRMRTAALASGVLWLAVVLAGVLLTKTA